MKNNEFVTVNFISGINTNTSRNYEFKNHIKGLEVGDLVVVDTANGLGIARISGFKGISNIANKYVVQKIDLTEHIERLEKDKKIAEIKEKMEERRKKAQELEVYRILAKEDEEMAKLLAELESIK